jgi:hypothetical protein
MVESKKKEGEATKELGLDTDVKIKRWEMFGPL